MKYFLAALLLCIAGLCAHAQDIILDHAFGNNGIVSKSPEKRSNVFWEQARSGIELPDGKLLFAVEVNTTARLSRYFPDGTLDKSYGTDGYSDPVKAMQSRIVRATDGKILLVGVNVAAGQNFVIGRYDENGSLDASFGNKGVRIIPIWAQHSELKSIALQNDGKIVFAGRQTHTGKMQGFVMRLLPDGTPDMSFANAGLLKVDGPGVTVVSSIALNGTSIVVGASSDFGSHSDFLVMQYLEDGTPDPGFGTSGISKIDIGNTDFLEAVAVQSDGKIVAAGTVGEMSWQRPNFTLVRLLPNGKLDGSFHETGITSVDVDPGNHLLRTLDIDAAGQITVSGIIQRFGHAFAFARFSGDGSLDKSFGEGGKKLLDFGQVGGDLNGGILKGDGSFVGIGFYFPYSVPNSTLDFMLIHLNADGHPNSQFGNNGMLTGFIPGKLAGLYQPKLFSDGKVIVRYTAFGENGMQGLIRYLPDGTTDVEFAEQGILKTSAYLFDVLPDQSIVTFESVHDNTTYTNSTVMSRYTKEGKPDLSFGKNGQKVISLRANSYLSATALQPGGGILLTGWFSNERWQQQGFMVRLDADGNVDKQFGAGGEVAFSAEPFEYPEQPTIQPDGKIVVKGFMVAPPNYNLHFFVRRFTEDGMLDESFGEKGTINGSNGLYSYANRTLIHPDGKLLVASVTTSNNQEYKSVLLRYNEDGTPDESFGNKGIASVPDVTVALLKNNKILITTRIPPQSESDAALVLLNADGSLDQSFGVNGTKTFKLSDWNDGFHDLIVKDNKIFVTGNKNIGLDQEGILASFLIQEAPVVTLACTQSKTVSTDMGQCSAVVGDVDPILMPSGESAVVNYTLNGATSGTGTGAVSGLSFGRGVTTVSYALASDPTQTCSFTIEVQDKEAPVVSNLQPSTMILSAPNHQMENVQLSYTTADNCGPVKVKVEVTSNEAVTGSGSGNTSPDWEVVNANLVQLRAERSGQGNGRVYTITVTATDDAGNHSSANTTVSVPKGNGHNALQVSASPNPSAESFVISIKSDDSKNRVHLRLLDITGMVVGQYVVSPNSTLRVGADLRPGTYLLEATQGNRKTTYQLLKQNR